MTIMNNLQTNEPITQQICIVSTFICIDIHRCNGSTHIRMQYSYELKISIIQMVSSKYHW